MALPSIQGTGNVVADPDLRFTHNGKPVATVRVACSRAKQNDQGEWETLSTTFLNVKVWGPEAETAAENLRKGMRVSFTGALETDDWVDRDGNKRVGFQVAFATIHEAEAFTPQASSEPAPF